MTLTKEEFKTQTGIDLEIELANLITNDTNSDMIDSFIESIENQLKMHYQANYGWNGTLTGENQTKQFKSATIYQIQWTLRNGSIWNDAGYNADNGMVIPLETLQKVSISPNAHYAMRLGGMANFIRG